MQWHRKIKQEKSHFKTKIWQDTYDDLKLRNMSIFQSRRGYELSHLHSKQTKLEHGNVNQEDEEESSLKLLEKTLNISSISNSKVLAISSDHSFLNNPIYSIHD